MDIPDACHIYPSTEDGSKSSQSKPCTPVPKRRGENVNVHLNILNVRCLCVGFTSKVLSLSKLVNCGVTEEYKHERFLISPKSLLNFILLHHA